MLDPEKLGFQKITSVEADKKGRVTLAKAIAKAGAHEHRFTVYVNEGGQIVLDPTVEIPSREQWLYRNPKALKALERGLVSAATEKTVDRGSFARYADEDE